MKKLSWFNKLVFFLNMVVTVLTFVAYVLPFLAPKVFPILSVFTLLLPLMLVLNFLFFIYWLLQFKKQMLLSGIVLLLGITFINKFYKFSQENVPQTQEDFTLMSYNVRMFNLYRWVPDINAKDSIKQFVGKQDPDILCFQEYAPSDDVYFNHYKYKYIFSRNDRYKTGQAIFSKFPIVDKGSIKFPKSSNNVIYADLKKGNDTIRVYSMHMQSIKIAPDIHEKIDEEKSKRIFKRLSEAFAKQQLQAELLVAHKQQCNYPTIICGDLNNSAFSYVYRSIKGDMNDAFEEVGSGFGKSYNFKYYPARIDYIFSDNNFQTKSFNTFNGFVNSDHFPIMARLAITTKEDK
ncbi:endonuclease/exonuclease/phosphatase family protein [Flavobacterium litorale]|uniref:Endonuclease/exonuclease/phosphatase family protein n=1 Tax=Flavobacterium litorale TaxID=2856519 RepID=A0ABX8V6G6_9FLAO|nr:endonuclease/exonuclease/phosphatase family protein [Flavobacterium litorale]QYJ68433.1 endonuclease/exonuclease/phosphatase family protein [Flavobacterium litorale]